MKKLILTYTLFLFLGGSLLAQHDEPIQQQDIITMSKPAEEQGLPVVTDIIFGEDGVVDSKLVVSSQDEIMGASFSSTVAKEVDGSEDGAGIDGNNTNSIVNGEGIEKENVHTNCGELTVYPNPARDYVNITLPTRKTYDIYLYDMLGSQKASWTFTDSDQERLDLSEFQTGIYFIQAVCGPETKTLRIKIVK